MHEFKKKQQKTKIRGNREVGNHEVEEIFAALLPTWGYSGV